jgi:hypothetical protein
MNTTILAIDTHIEGIAPYNPTDPAVNPFPEAIIAYNPSIPFGRAIQALQNHPERCSNCPHLQSHLQPQNGSLPAANHPRTGPNDPRLQQACWDPQETWQGRKARAEEGSPAFY